MASCVFLAKRGNCFLLEVIGGAGTGGILVRQGQEPCPVSHEVMGFHFLTC